MPTLVALSSRITATLFLTISIHEEWEEPGGTTIPITFRLFIGGVMERKDRAEARIRRDIYVRGLGPLPKAEEPPTTAAVQKDEPHIALYRGEIFR